MNASTLKGYAEYVGGAMFLVAVGLAGIYALTMIPVAGPYVKDALRKPFA